MAAETQALLRTLLARDAFAGALGAELLEAGTGRAALRMTVRADHLNFNGTCHGGVIFALADAAFGLASNSRGEGGIGIDAHVSYSAAVRPGDQIIATAVEATRSTRLATYRVEVRRGDDRVAALFTGTVFIAGSETAPAAPR